MNINLIRTIHLKIILSLLYIFPAQFPGTLSSAIVVWFNFFVTRKFFPFHYRHVLDFSKQFATTDSYDSEYIIRFLLYLGVPPVPLTYKWMFFVQLIYKLCSTTSLSQTRVNEKCWTSN